ncbi:uncharacterized protein LOC128727603 [Anopheles nili]|uniref:uncharacterized protein LOC128727603 n=1 Tax=Anopheles nili TaxID=185578 RepID=UPI00237A9E55|nr:uncharacterized protein LOC128727603 [Anopheles nili]
MLENREWLIGTVSDRLLGGSYTCYYNVFIADGYEPITNLLQSLSYWHYDSSGRSLLVIDSNISIQSITQIMKMLWKLRIVNVVVIVPASYAPGFIAYEYDPYREEKCEVIEPILLDRFHHGRWGSLHTWFSPRFRNFKGCSLNVATFVTKPYSMIRKEGNDSVRFGMEITIAENIAEWFNFTIAYKTPHGTVKWGIPRARNSTGLMGMIQRHEVEFGFGSLGFNVFRNKYLKMGKPSIMSQLNVAIPADKPYTSLEKLSKPFAPAAWLCIILCYLFFSTVTLLLFDSKFVTPIERFRNPGYNLWELLMGGPSMNFQRTSLRIFITGFVLNALVMRTMYQSAMFQRLQATTKLATQFNTFQHINEANLLYYMYITTTMYYKDNPLLGDRIRILWDETQETDEIMYDILQYKLNGVFAISLDCIEYYVKTFGQRGLVYTGKHTGINYNLGMYYPKVSPLVKPFNTIIGRYETAGLIYIWREQFRDTRYWSNAQTLPENKSLQWQHVSGAFYLWALFLTFALVVLLGEIIMNRRKIKHLRM